jgi:hypothetical protein
VSLAGVTRFKFAVLTVGGLRKLRYRRWQYATLTELKGQFREERFFQIKTIRFKFRCCGCDPLQIRRSDGWQIAQVALPAVAICHFN